MTRALLETSFGGWLVRMPVVAFGIAGYALAVRKERRDLLLPLATVAFAACAIAGALGTVSVLAHSYGTPDVRLPYPVTTWAAELARDLALAFRNWRNLPAFVALYAAVAALPSPSSRSPRGCGCGRPPAASPWSEGRAGSLVHRRAARGPCEGGRSCARSFAPQWLVA